MSRHSHEAPALHPVYSVCGHKAAFERSRIFWTPARTQGQLCLATGQCAKIIVYRDRLDRSPSEEDRVESSEPQVEPVPSEPLRPEITPTAPKPRRRKMLVVLIVVAIIIIAAVATFFVLYLGSGSIFVTSNSQFIPAGGSTSFTATVTPPPFVSSTGMQWDFGDGNKQSSTGDTIAHTYANPGNYFVLSTASLSNGKTVDNARGLFPVQVGAAPVTNPNPLGTTSALGALAFNRTASTPDAPFIAVGGHIAFVAAVAQPPDFQFDDLVDSVANSWVNYTWQVTRLTINFGDGSTPATNNSRLENATTNTLVADPYMISHTYNSGGIFSVSLTVTTGNFSAAQTNSTPAHPVLTATGQSQTTVVGLTVAVGSYREITYSGNVIKPGIITNMEAVTGGYTTLDPALDYESTGFEVISNIYETLLAYNGTSTSNFVPVVADQIPTVANGRVSPDFMNYTFHIRQGLKFSNGDAITAWDVKYSISRTMLFDSGSPFPPGWIISQFLVPGTFISSLTNPPGCDLTKPGCSLDAAKTFSVVDGAIEVDNASQT